MSDRTLTRGRTVSPISSSIRDRRLSDILESAQIPTPPAVAMRIVRMTTHPDCTAAEISEMLRQDPGICARVLKAINSCVYGLPAPVSSIDRAVVVLGLNTVRSIVLTLSLPAMQFTGVPDRVLKDHWLSSVSGAIIARELSLRMREPLAEDDLLCGLLRDLGALILRQRFPDDCRRFRDGMAGRPFSDFCSYERELFGVDHAELSAELLVRWRLPSAITEPIRYHHEPGRMRGAPHALIERAERLAFVVALTNLDLVAHNPAEVDTLLKTAARYRLSQSELVEFLQAIVPKIDAFTEVMSIDVGRCPDYASTLATGCGELVKLAVQSGGVTMAEATRPPRHNPTAVTLRAGDGEMDFEVNSPAESAGLETEPVEGFPTSGSTIGGFVLESELGRGAMGLVFKARETSLDRTVAIKIMAPDLAGNDVFRQRFVREARSAAAIRHDNVVNLYGVWDTPRCSYLSMEYIEGTSLDDLIGTSHPLPFARIRDIAIQIAAGLGSAHDRKIIHRDLKPSNILIEGASGRVKLTDFGLARGERDTRLTEIGSVVGTPQYMSPEQAAGLQEDARSDLFSLGGVLYTLATGRPPFDGNSIPAVLMKVCNEQPVSIRQLRPDLPQAYRASVEKLLRKKPDARYASAGELIDDLRKIEIAPVAKAPAWRRWFR